MITVDKLRSYGADVDSGLSRCMDSEEFYLRMVNMFLSEQNFDKLDKAFADNDMTAAFEAAHALKGVSANLSLTPINKVIAELSDLLKVGTVMDYADLLEKVRSEKAKLDEMQKEE